MFPSIYYDKIINKKEWKMGILKWKVKAVMIIISEDFGEDLKK